MDLSKVPFGSLWILPPKLKVPFGSLWILPPKLKNSNWHQVQLSWFPLNFWRITDDDFHDFHETSDWPYFKWNIIVISGSLCLWKGFEAEPCLCVWFLFLLLLVVFAWTGCVAYVHSWRHLPDRSAGIQDWRVKPYWNWVVKSLIWICLRPGLVMTRTQGGAVEVTVIVRHWDVKGSVQHCHYEHSFFCCFCPMAQVEKVDLFDSLSQSLSFVVVLNHGCCWLHFWCEAAGPGSEVVAAGSSSDDGFDPTAHYSGQSDDDADPWEKSDELLISTHERMIRAMTIIPRLEVFLGWQKNYLLAEPQITCWHCWPAFQCQGWNIKPLGWAATSDFHRQVKCDLLWIHCPINFVYWVTAEIWNHSCEFNHCHWNTGTWNG